MRRGGKLSTVHTLPDSIITPSLKASWCANKNQPVRDGRKQAYPAFCLFSDPATMQHATSLLPVVPCRIGSHSMLLLFVGCQLESPVCKSSMLLKSGSRTGILTTLQCGNTHTRSHHIHTAIHMRHHLQSQVRREHDRESE